MEVVEVAPALVSQNIEGSNGSREPEDSTRFLIFPYPTFLLILSSASRV